LREVDAQNMKVAVTNVQGEFDADKQRPCKLDQVEKFGITNFCDEIFESPQVVKEAMKRVCSVHRVCAGSQETIKHVDHLITNTPINIFFTPEAIYTKTKSAYGNRDTSTQIIPLKQARWFSGVGSQEKIQIEQQLKEATEIVEQFDKELQQFNQQEKSIQQETKQLKEQRDELTIGIRKREQLEKKISYKEEQLQELMTEEDTKKEEEKIEAKIKQLSLKRLGVAQQMKDVMISLVEGTLKLDTILISRLVVSNTLQTLKNQDHLYDHEFKQLKQRANECSDAFQIQKEKARKLKNAAESKAPLTVEIKELFKQLPDTLEEIEEEIHTATTKAEMSYTNSAVIEQYEKRNKEIAVLIAKVDDEDLNLNELKAEIEKIKGEWLPPLQELVQKINNSFKTYFAEIGCAGEVELIQNEDYDKYAIQIRVKFRENQPMSALNAQTQSGGERSVSTMLYLISLQDLTPCPFRLVDEINQGMDPNNERMIFGVVTKCACKPGLPQYFLITPKLLPDLQFTPEMTILCIFNGPWNSQNLDLEKCV